MVPRHVLFVDDDEVMLSALGQLLRDEPYEAHFASNGADALALLARQPLAVVVTDLVMPDLDGMTLLERIQNDYNDVIRVVMSALDDTDSILEAINRGSVYRYVVKPLNSLELKITVKQAIDLYNIQQEKKQLLDELAEANRKLEERVAQRTRQLLAVNRQAEIGKYASHIVHNLNSPLQAIFSSLEITRMFLGDATPDLTKVDKILGNIKNSAKDLEQITRTILLHARDKSLYQSGLIDVNEVLRAELEFFQFDPIYRRQVEKRIDLPDDVPKIFGNPIQIKQIVDNLIKNAIDAMEQVEFKQLSVSTRSLPDAVEIRIQDTGEGIVEEDLPRIFSSDFSTKPVGKGTGLGLASVKTMVDAYRGEISVESTVGTGTAFTVIIPTGAPFGSATD